MNLKKIMLVSVILLAILTIGAVSASDDVDFVDNLTVSSDIDESINLSVENDEIIAAEDSQEDILEDVSVVEDDEIDEEFEIYELSSGFKENNREIVTIFPPKDAIGEIVLKLDDIEVYSLTLNGTNEYWYSIYQKDIDYDLEYETYDMELTYSGDEKYDSFTKEFSYEVYCIKASYGNYKFGDSEFYAYISKMNNLTGPITILINGKSTFWTNYNVSSTSDRLGYSIRDLKFGENNYTLIYGGNGVFPAKTSYAVINVNPNIEFLSNAYGNASVKVSFPAYTHGNLVVAVDGNEIANNNYYWGDATFSLSNLDVGYHNMTVSYVGDDYNVSTVSNYFYITPRIDVINRGYGENVTVTITASDDINGSINVYTINDDSYKFDEYFYFDDGKISFNLTDLPMGSTEFKVYYYFSNKYMPSQFIVINVQPISYIPSAITYPNYENISINMPSDAKGNIIIYSNGEVYYNSTVTDCNVSVSTEKLLYGDNNIVLTYDGDDYAFGNVTGKITIIPKLTYYKKIWTGMDNYFSIELSPENNGNLSVYQNWEDYSVSAPVVNGKGKVKLENIPLGDYDYYTIEYTDDNGYVYSVSTYITVSDESPYFEMNVNIPNQVLIGNDIKIQPYFPRDSNGYLAGWLDGELLINNSISGWSNMWWDAITLQTSDLSEGEHNLVFKYTGDSYNVCEDENYTFTVAPISFDVPSEIILDGISDSGRYSTSAQISISTVSYELDGRVILLIDGEIYSNSSARYIWSINLKQVSVGEHDYEIRYCGSNTYQDLVQTGSFNATYLFDVDFIREIESDNLRLFIPVDANNNVTFTLNGKNYTKQLPSSYSVYEYYDYDSDKFVYLAYKLLELDDLDVGQYELSLTYLGDAKYPQRTIVKNITVDAVFLSSNYDIKYGENITIYLKTYLNSTGNFTYGNISVPVINGKANITVHELNLGSNSLRASYVGNDYRLDHSYYFSLSPLFKYPTGYVWINADKIATVQVPEKYNGTFKIVDYWDGGNVYYAASVVNGYGIVNMSNCSVGTNRYNFRFESENGNVYSESGSLTVREEDPNSGCSVSMDSEILQGTNVIAEIILPNNPQGTLYISVDNGSEYTYTFDGYAWDNEYTIRTSSLESGEHEIRIVYEDSYYNTFDEVYTVNIVPIKVEVPHEIILGDEEPMYVRYASGLNGTVAVYIDGNLVTNRSLFYTSFSLDLSYLDCGEHTYEVFYSELPDYTESGSFNVTYEFYMNFYGENYGEELEIAIVTYYELEGNVTIIAGGKTYTIQADSWVSVKVSDLPYGENLITATYEGDGKYPSRTINETVNIKAKLNVPYDAYYGKEIASIIMPEDANGYLIVTIDGVEYSSPVVNGNAEVITPLLSIDGRWVNARYNGADYAVDDVDRYVSFRPGIKFPEVMWKGGDFNVTILMPETYNGTFTASISGDEYVGSVVNGVGFATITNLTRSGSLQVYGKYSDDDYSYQTSSRIYSYSSGPDVNITADFRSDYLFGEKWAYWNSITFPSPRNGVVDALVDGNLVEVKQRYIDIYEDEIYKWAFSLENITAGKHTVELRYHDDPYYINSSVIFEMDLATIKLNVPSEIEIDYNEYMEVAIAENIKGNLTIEIDGKEFKKVLLSKEILIKSSENYYDEWDEYQGTVSLNGLTGGEHSYKMTFAADGFDDYVIEGKFNVSYRLSVSLEYGVDYIYYGDDANLGIYLPSEANGNVSVVINNKTYRFKYSDYENILTISDLEIGDYVAVVTYEGDDSLPAKSVNYSFTVRAKLIIPERLEYGKDSIYIVLPSDATGSLRVRVDYSKTYTVALVDGKANVTLDDYDLGVYWVSASYTGSDYAVGSDSGYVEIIPRVDIPILGTSGEYEVTISMPDNHNGDFEVVVDGVKYQTSVENGKGTIILSNLASGYCDIELSYSEDDDYYFEDDYFVNVRGYDDDFVLNSEVDRDYLVGENVSYYINLPYLATGNLTMYVDGELFKVFDVQKDDLYGDLPLSKLTIGKHTIDLKYSGDEYFHAINATDVFNVGYITGLPEKLFVGLYQDYLLNNYTLRFHESLNGYAILLIDGKEYAKEMIFDHEMQINPINITEGNHTYKIQYFGLKDTSLTKTDSFNAISDKMSVYLPSEIVLGETVELTVNMPFDATGTVVIAVGDDRYSSKIESGVAKFKISGLTLGTHNVTGAYSGDSKYLPYTVSLESITVKHGIYVVNGGYGEDIIVSIELPSDAEGKFIVYCNEAYEEIALVDGKANFTIHNCTYGEYDIESYYDGEDYDVNHVYETVYIEPEIELDAPRIMEMGSDESMTINLPDVKGDLLVVVENYYNDEIISTLANLTNVSGKQIIPLSNIDQFGNAYVRYIFTPYDGSADSSGRSILVTPKITIPKEIEVGSDEYLIVELPQDATAVVSVYIRNDYYEQYYSEEHNLTLLNGKAQLSLAGLPVGKYSVFISFEDEKYGYYYEVDDIAYGGTHQLTVTKTQLSAKLDNSSDKLTIIVPSDATGYFYFNNNGKDYIVEINNSKAVIDNVNSLDELMISYSGDDKYASFKKLVTSSDVVEEIVPIDPNLNIQVSNIEEGEIAVVDVEINKNITFVNVNVGDKTYSVSITNGKGKLNVSDLSAGEYTVIAKFAGNKYFLNAEKTAKFNVTKVQTPDTNTTGNETSGNGTGNETGLVVPDVVVPVLNNVSGNATVVVSLPDDATGSVTLTVAGKDYVFDVINGKANVKLPYLANGDYPYTIKYSGDDKYYEFVESKNLTVNNVNNATGNETSGNGTDTNSTGNETSGNGTGNETGLVVPDVVVPVLNNVSGNVTVVVSLPGDATGSVTLTVAGKDYVFDVINGKANVKLPDLSNGDYPYTIKYSGDDKYYEFVESKNLTVNNVNNATGNETSGNGTDTNSTGNETSGNGTDTNSTGNESGLVVPDVVVPVMDDVSSDEIVVVDLPGDAAGSVTLTVGGKDYVFDVVDGKANVQIPKLAKGDNAYTIKYSGDNKYQSYSESGVITRKDSIGTVIVVESSFSRYATDFDAGERGAKFEGILYDVDGNPLANKTVQISVNGPVYNITSDKDGKVGLNVNLAKANTYTYALLFYGDEEYKASPMASTKLTVVKKPTNIIANNMAFKTSAKTKTVTVALNTIKNPFDGKMYLKTGKKLTLTVNGKSYTAKTGVNGVASFNIKITKKGVYNAKITFDGDSTYESTSKSIKIVVSNSPSKNTALSGVGVGTNPANVDAGGSLNIEGNYDEYLENITTSDSDSIKKDTVIDVESTFTRVANDFNAGERGAMFYAILKDSNGKALANKTVQIAVNGPVYDVVTDSQGRAGLTVNLAKANTYTYALAFSGDDDYNPAPIASSKLTVTKKTTSITASAVSFKKSAKTKTVSVTLKTTKNPYDGKTYLSSGKKLTLNVGGKTYTAKIDAKGVAKFNIKLTKKGTYTAKINFAGDSTYNAASKNIKITIK